MKVFEYIIWADEKKDKQTGEVTRKAEIIVPATQVLAKDEPVVQIIASKQIPDTWNDNLDEVNVQIRPF